MDNEKRIVMDMLLDTVRQERELDKYIYQNAGSILDVQLDNMLGKMDALYDEKKKLINYLHTMP